MILNTKIRGIPCRIKVTRYFVQKPLGRMADSPEDCYGYTAIDYEVLDRRGRPASWLERKMTDDDRCAIENEVTEAEEAERDSALEYRAEERYLMEQ